MNPVRRCSALLQRDFTALCLSSLGSAPKTETPKRVASPSSRYCHQSSVGEVLTCQPQVKPGGSSSVSVNTRIAGPMGSGSSSGSSSSSSSSSRLFGTLAQTLSSPSIPLALPAALEDEDEDAACDPADPDLLLRECEEALRNRPARWHRCFMHPPHEDTNPRAPSPDQQPIRVMQWNILAQALGEGKDGFVRCPLDALNWAERKYLILEEILTYQPDVLCLQEVDHYFDTFRPVLSSLGYQSSFCPKPWSPCLDVENNNGPDGCALFFRRERFEPLATNHLRLSAMMLKTNQVAVVTTLRCRASGRRFCVAVTHLKARSGWETLRSAQGSSLLQSLCGITAEMAAQDAGGAAERGDEAAGVPLIVCGDFNAEPWEDVYRRFASSPLGLDSAYKQLSADGLSEPPYTSWKIRRSSGESRHTLDYIWYSSRRFCVDSVLELPNEEQIGPDRLPSYHYPSDHLSLVCDFSFSEPTQSHRLL